MKDVDIDDAVNVAKALRVCGFDDACDECPLDDKNGNITNPSCCLEKRAADLLEAQAERIAELEDAIDKARRIIGNSLSTDRCDYCDNREKYPQECDGYCNECKLDCVCKGCTLVSGRF